MTYKNLVSRVSVMRTGAALLCSIFVLTVIFKPTGAHAEYQLSIGDKLRVYVFGHKELDHSATVDSSGRIWVPTIGQILAAGRTLADVRQNISKTLTANEIIRAEDINVEVLEFRPFYIDGTVNKAGSYPYRPNMTVRQGIALAGGFVRNSAKQTGLFNTVDPRISYQSLWSQYIQRQARATRLQAELQGQDQFEWAPSPNLLVPPAKLTRISDLEQKQFQARAESFEQEKQNLDELIKLAKNEIALLDRQNQRLEQEDDRVTAMLKKLQDLRDKGVVRMDRIATFERDVFSARYARDSTRSQLAGARRMHSEFVGKRAQLELERRKKLTFELNRTVSELDALQSQMIAAANRLQFSSATIEWLRGICKPRAKKGVSIHRTQGGQSEHFKASEDSEILPGDVISVNVLSEELEAQCLALDVLEEHRLTDRPLTQ